MLMSSSKLFSFSKEVHFISGIVLCCCHQARCLLYYFGKINSGTESTFDHPSHIVIHVGTNDIEQSPIDSCSSQFQTLVDVASQKYPSSKVLISSLLKRRDAADFHRSELNSKLGRICASFPNVHLVNNENIPIEYLHDNKHLKRRKIGALATNLKDVIYNRIRPPLLSGKNSKPIPPLLPRPPPQAKFYGVTSPPKFNLRF